jgi:hypothetical protein
MSVEEFMKQQYITLRDEIRAAKARMFVLMVLGSLVILVSGIVAQNVKLTYAEGSLPLIVLVLMMAFVMEQNSVIRAGRYLKEHVEPHLDGITTWEKWLESNRALRAADRYFFGSIMLIFFLFYLLGAGFALMSLACSEWRDQMWPAAMVYGIGGLWFVVVLLGHWRACTTTAQ